MDPYLCTASGFYTFNVGYCPSTMGTQLQLFHTDEIITNKMLIIMSHKTVLY